MKRRTFWGIILVLGASAIGFFVWPGWRYDYNEDTSFRTDRLTHELQIQTPDGWRPAIDVLDWDPCPKVILPNTEDLSPGRPPQ